MAGGAACRFRILAGLLFQGWPAVRMANSDLHPQHQGCPDPVAAVATKGQLNLQGSRHPGRNRATASALSAKPQAGGQRKPDFSMQKSLNLLTNPSKNSPLIVRETLQSQPQGMAAFTPSEGLGAGTHSSRMPAALAIGRHHKHSLRTALTKKSPPNARLVAPLTQLTFSALVTLGFSGPGANLYAV